ncbi:MAG: tyrosine-type recombinase/integrase [Lachnospiraceae bacterium]|nr:tyrosine-type recombinase/integrase [Lachnospiraceae bacterium]
MNQCNIMNAESCHAPSLSSGTAAMDASAKDVLDFLVQNGMINTDDVLEKMKQKERESLVASCHSYKIWQSTDGRWRTYIADDSNPRGRRLVIKTSKKTLEEFLIDHYQAESEADKMKRYTLRTLYPEWKEYKRLHTTAETYISRIDTDWKTYYMGTEIIDVPIRKLDKLALDNWAHQLIKDHDMTKNQYFNVTVIMRQALHYAVDSGIIEVSPFDAVKIDGKRLFRKVKKKPDYTQVFTKEEAKLMSELAWEDYHNHVKVYDLAPIALLFQMQTGLRIGELVTVKFSDIESPDYLHVQRMIRRDTNEVVEHPKSECGDRYVPLTSEAKALIETAKARQQELHAENEYIFSINGKPPTERSIASLYTKYCKIMGIIQKSSHKTRKTYISKLIDGKVSINTVRTVAGHSSERTTLRNYAFDCSTETEKLQKIEDALKI